MKGKPPLFFGRAEEDKEDGIVFSEAVGGPSTKLKGRENVPRLKVGRGGLFFK